jgi:hypothetical protein
MPLKVSDGVGAWIHDFVHSTNERFKGKSKKKRIQQALGAFYGAKNFHGKEGLDPIITDSPILQVLGEIDFNERDVSTLDFRLEPLEGNRISSEINGDRYHHFPKAGISPADYYNRVKSIYARSPDEALKYMKDNSRDSRKLEPLPKKPSDVGY